MDMKFFFGSREINQIMCHAIKISSNDHKTDTLFSLESYFYDKLTRTECDSTAQHKK